MFLLSAGGAFGQSKAVRQSINRQVFTYKTIDGFKLKIHVWTPAGWSPHRKRPAVVFYHGGGWRHGSWDNFEGQAEYFASRGLVTISVEYRTRGPIPATVDGIDAMNYVFRHVARLGIDPAKVIVAGGSAGGEIALATLRANLPHSDPANKPSAVILFNPVTDTTGAYPNGWGRGQFATEQQAKQYSPYRHIRRGNPPTLIMQGTGDTTASFRNSARFVTKMLEAGNRAALIAYQGEPHGFFNQRNGHNPYYYETVRQTDRFLVSLGYLSGAQTIKLVPPQLVDDGSFTRGLMGWSAVRGTDLRLVTQPVHNGSKAVSISGDSDQIGLTQDITAEIAKYGAGVYYFGAWLSTGYKTDADVSIRITLKNATDAHWRSYALPTAIVNGRRFARVSGTKIIEWKGKLDAARLEIMTEADNAYVDDASVEFLWGK